MALSYRFQELLLTRALNPQVRAISIISEWRRAGDAFVSEYKSTAVLMRPHHYHCHGSSCVLLNLSSYVLTGTSCAGSTWAMIPLPPNVLGPRCVCSPNDRYQPANYSCGCLKGEEKIACTSPGNCSKGACLPCPGTPGSDCSRCSNGVGDSFEPPCGGCYGGSQPTVKDVVKVLIARGSQLVELLVQVPANLPPGKYVLGFRYDCEATAQGMCASWSRTNGFD